jgi:hypothetical protein
VLRLFVSHDLTVATDWKTRTHHGRREYSRRLWPVLNCPQRQISE